MSNYKKIIIIVLILVLVVALLLLVLLKRNRDNTPSNVTKENSTIEEPTSAVATQEKDISKYYTIEGILKEFNTYVSYLNTSVQTLGVTLSTGENESDVLQEYRDDAFEYMNDVLADKYKEKYNVDNSYIYNALSKYSGKNYTINNMYVLKQSSRINTYFVYGKYEETEFNFILVLDSNTNAFEVYLNNFVKDGKYTNGDVISMRAIDTKELKENDNNTFYYKQIEEGSLAKSYYEEFVKLMKENPMAAYNKLNAEYKAKRFPNYEVFKSYVDEVIVKKQFTKLVKYQITELDEYSEYVCKDNYGKNTIFIVNNPGNYTVLIDSYTIPVKTYENQYNEASETTKAQLSLNKFFECINNKDYKTAYGYLNETFKLNTLRSEEIFEEYIKENWFDINGFTYTGGQQSGESYILSGKIYDMEDAGSFDPRLIEQKFIIRLGNDISDFQISFQI